MSKLICCNGQYFDQNTECICGNVITIHFCNDHGSKCEIGQRDTAQKHTDTSMAMKNEIDKLIVHNLVKLKSCSECKFKHNYVTTS